MFKAFFTMVTLNLGSYSIERSLNSKTLETTNVHAYKRTTLGNITIDKK